MPCATGPKLSRGLSEAIQRGSYWGCPGVVGKARLERVLCVLADGCMSQEQTTELPLSSRFWAHTPSAAPTCCVILGRWLASSEAKFPHVWTGNDCRCPGEESRALSGTQDQQVSQCLELVNALQSVVAMVEVVP